MTPRKAALMFLFLAALIISCREREQVSPQVPITATRISNRVTVLECLDTNVTAVATLKGILLIDTHRSPSLMAEIAKEIERVLGRRDFKYVINTHGHPDHCSGNQVFPGALLIAHQNCPAFLARGRADSPLGLWDARLLLKEARKKASAPNPNADEARALGGEIRAREMLLADLQGRYVATPPSLTFEDHLTLDLGDVHAELRFCGEAHTNNDIFVYIPEEKVLLTGDLFCSPPSLCFRVNPLADVPRLVSVIDDLLGRDTGLEHVIPGHGPPMTRADLAALRDTLAERYAAFRGKRSSAQVLGRMIEESGIEAGVAGYRRLVSDEAGETYRSEEEFDLLGRRFLRKGMPKEAIAVFELSLEAFPESSLLHSSLAGALLESGDARSAIASYEKALALSPASADVAEMLRVLREK